MDVEKQIEHSRMREMKREKKEWKLMKVGGPPHLTNNHEDRSFLPLHRHPRRWYVMLVLGFDWRQRKDEKLLGFE